METALPLTQSQREPLKPFPLAELRERLPESITKLPVVKVFIRTLILLAVVVSLGVTIALVGPIWLKLLLALPMGSAIFMLAIMGHESGHGSGSRLKVINELIGTFSMTILALPCRAWKVKHDLHHRYVGIHGKDTDSEMSVSSYEKKRGLMKWVAKALSYGEFLLWPLIIINLFKTQWKWAFKILFNRQKYKSVWGWNLSDMIIGFAVIGAVITAIVMTGWAGVLTFVFAGLIPLLVAGWWAAAMFVPHHRGMDLLSFPMQSQAIKFSYVNSRSTTFPKLFGFMHNFSNGLQYQIEHHLLPRIPGHNLPKLTHHVQKIAKEKEIPLLYERWHKVVFSLGVNRWLWGDKDHKLHTFRTLQAEAEQADAAAKAATSSAPLPKPATSI